MPAFFSDPVQVQLQRIAREGQLLRKVASATRRPIGLPSAPMSAGVDDSAQLNNDVVRSGEGSDRSCETPFRSLFATASSRNAASDEAFQRSSTK